MIIILTLVIFAIAEVIAMKKEKKMFEELFEEVDSITSKTKQ